MPYYVYLGLAATLIPLAAAVVSAWRNRRTPPGVDPGDVSGWGERPESPRL